jgi:hypothetical protein
MDKQNLLVETSAICRRSVEIIIGRDDNLIIYLKLYVTNMAFIFIKNLINNSIKTNKCRICTM